MKGKLTFVITEVEKPDLFEFALYAIERTKEGTRGLQSAAVREEPARNSRTRRGGKKKLTKGLVKKKKKARGGVKKKEEKSQHVKSNDRRSRWCKK